MKDAQEIAPTASNKWHNSERTRIIGVERGTAALCPKDCIVRIALRGTLIGSSKQCVPPIAVSTCEMTSSTLSRRRFM